MANLESNSNVNTKSSDNKCKIINVILSTFFSFE